MKNIMICDKCGKVGNMEFISQMNEPSYYSLPMGWRSLGNIELCNECCYDFEKWLSKKYFMPPLDISHKEEEK